MKYVYTHGGLIGVLICSIVFFICAGASAQNFSSIAAESATVATEEAREETKMIDDLATAQAAEVRTTLGYPLQDDSAYTLGINDVIDITVMRHPEVSGQYSINKEGKIQYEFVGDVSVIGMTKDRVRDILVKKLAEYVIDPDVNIKIVGYNSKVVYVIGEVAQPGRIFMRGDTITIHEALVQAGLPLLSASTKKCRLITPSADGKSRIRYVNVFDLLYEGDLRENLVMKPGDTLYIPATVMAKAMRVIAPVTQPISAASSAAGPIKGF